MTDALRPDVVLLTKDLNGNHVIQKCLNKLESSNNQVYLQLRCAYDSSFMMQSLRIVLKLLLINMAAVSFSGVSIMRAKSKPTSFIVNLSRILLNCRR